MTCPRLSEETTGVLLDYSSGRLDSDRGAALEDHMHGCFECAAFVADQRVLWSALDGWEPEPVSVDFNRRLWQRIDLTRAEPWPRRLMDALRFGAWKPVFPLGAVAMIVAAGFLFDHRGGSAAPPVPMPVVSSTAAVSTVEAEQAEKTLDDLQLLKQLDAVGS